MYIYVYLRRRSERKTARHSEPHAQKTVRRLKEKHSIHLVSYSKGNSLSEHLLRVIAARIRDVIALRIQLAANRARIKKIMCCQ